MYFPSHSGEDDCGRDNRTSKNAAADFIDSGNPVKAFFPETFFEAESRPHISDCNRRCLRKKGWGLTMVFSGCYRYFMADKKNLENQLAAWRNFSLMLLLLMGIIGALSYTLLFRQKERLDLQELRIVQLTDAGNDLEGELNGDAV